MMRRRAGTDNGDLCFKFKRALTEKERTARHLESQRREANRPLGICLVLWQNRLHDAVLEHPERSFFGFHFTHLGWLALLMIPCILFLIATADYSRMAEPDED